MSTMRAARFYGNRDIRVEDVPIPEAGPGQCVVEVEWCGICGSDLHEYAAGLYFNSTPFSGINLYPIIYTDPPSCESTN